MAKRVIVKTFLSDVLGVSEEQAEIDSCKIEHLISHSTGERLEEFRHVYTATMNRREVGQGYYFPAAFYQQIQRGLAGQFAYAMALYEGRVVSAHHKLAATERHLRSKQRNPRLWKRYDGEFHHALISNCGSRALLDTHATVFDRYFRYQILLLNYRGEEPVHQHRQLLDCALARDASRAKAILVDHVNGCIAHALETDALT